MTTTTNKDVFEEILICMRKGKSPEDATELLLKKYPDLGLERYGIDEWMGDDGMMRRVHDMRLRIINSPSFMPEMISTAILFKDTVARGGAIEALTANVLKAILK